MPNIEWKDFEKIELIAGTILKVEDFPEGKKPAYKLVIDCGPLIGIKNSSAQITKLYKKEDLIRKQVLCVVNFPPKKIGPFISEVLTTGLMHNDEVILVMPERQVPNGTKLA